MSTPLFYNSLTKDIEPLSPREPGKVQLYHCGPTVYKRQHLGNLRRFLFADLLRRSLEFLGYEVREITNITDVGHLTQDELDAGEDKLTRAAREQKVTPQLIAEEQTKLFLQDLQTLNIQPSHKYPRASQHIPQMLTLIATLLEKKHAYLTKSGVYFDVQSFPAYGALSGNTVANLAAGKRIAVREEKKHPADFALWVIDPQSLQRWDSPWGIGYPGWHIECSAMSLAYLIPPIDIHTGGEDNRFPHHENEIAQSEAATGERFVTLWLHNAHLQMGGVKMAKRDGASLTLDTIIEHGFDPLAFRLYCFAAHYRSKVDFSWENLAVAQDHLNALTALLRRLHTHVAPIGQKESAADPRVVKTFAEALRNDLNTPAAWAILLQLIRQTNAQLDQQADAATAAVALATLHQLDRVVGIMNVLEQRLLAEHVPPEVTQLVADREAARVSKNFAEADRLRQIITQHGYLIEDSSTGPRLIKNP